MFNQNWAKGYFAGLNGEQPTDEQLANRDWFKGWLLGRRRKKQLAEGNHAHSHKRHSGTPRSI